MRARLGVLVAAVTMLVAGSATASAPTYKIGLKIQSVDAAGHTVTGFPRCAPGVPEGKPRTYPLDPALDPMQLVVGQTVGLKVRPTGPGVPETVLAVVAPLHCGDGKAAGPKRAQAPRGFFNRSFRTLEFQLGHPRGTHFTGRPSWQSLPKGAVRAYVTDTLGDRSINVDFKHASCDEHGAIDACTRWVRRISADGFGAYVSGRFKRIPRAPHLMFVATTITVHTHRPG